MRKDQFVDKCVPDLHTNCQHRKYTGKLELWLLYITIIKKINVVGSFKLIPVNFHPALSLSGLETIWLGLLELFQNSLEIGNVDSCVLGRTWFIHPCILYDWQEVEFEHIRYNLYWLSCFLFDGLFKSSQSNIIKLHLGAETGDARWTMMSVMRLTRRSVRPLLSLYIQWK